jgi:DNA-binding MarR family transcriptional regulator
VTPEQKLLSQAAKIAFRLNGQFYDIGEHLSRPTGLTAATWQVLGAVLSEPIPVAGIARAVGLTRQSVQRTADILVQQGLAEYVPNPAHQRAKLLRPTREGREAVGRIAPAHAAFAQRLAEEVGSDELRSILEKLTLLSEALTTVAPQGLAVSLEDARSAVRPGGLAERVPQSPPR